LGRKKLGQLAAPSESKAALASQQKLGIILAIAATLIFALQDAFTKNLVQNYPIGLIVFIRFWAFTAMGLALTSRKIGIAKAIIGSKRKGIQILRSLTLLGDLLLFALALKFLSLTDVTALFQTYPLFGSILAVIILKETLGWRRLTALIIGFIGMLVMIRPGTGIFSGGAFYVVIASALYGLYMTLTRLVSSFDRPETSLFWQGLIAALLLSFGLPFFWVPITFSDISLLIILCLLSVTSHFLMIKALSLAPVTLVQPFTYLQLVWASIVGYLAFSELPDGFTLIGATIVIASNLFILYRERAKSKPV